MFAAVLSCLAFGTGASHAQGRVYSVLVVPQFPATEIHRVWAPLLERLGRETGQHFELRLSQDIPSFEVDMRSGDADFLYLNPYHEVMAHQQNGYVPLVRDSKLLSGLIVVRKDSTVAQARDLQGKAMAFPAPHAFGATLLVKAVLAEKEHVRIESAYARTHTNAYRQVVTGQAAAAGGLRATLEREPEALQQQLRVLLETPGYAPHPLSAHPRVPAALRAQVSKAWLRMAQDQSLQPLFQSIPMANPVMADYDRDYAPLANLHLERHLD